jgi:hypothetical protein
LSNQEVSRIQTISARYTELQLELGKLEDKTKADAIVQEMQDLLTEFDGLNRREISIYNQSAEGFAKGKITSLLLVQNSWNITDNKPFFEGKTPAESIEFMENIDESEDIFQRNVLKVFLLIAGAYLNNDKLPQGSLDEQIKLVVNG